MVMIIRTAKEWVLVTICALLVAFNFIHPLGVELYPVLDFRGGNQFNMLPDKEVYRCGEMVKALTMYQKQREAPGVVVWTLVKTTTSGNDYAVKTYPPRNVTRPIGIYHEWREIEVLPENCGDGRFHFEGVVTFNLWLGKASYSMRTSCFKVEP